MKDKVTISLFAILGVSLFLTAFVFIKIQDLQISTKDTQTQMASIQQVIDSLFKLMKGTSATPKTVTNLTPESSCVGDIYCGEKYCSCSGGNTEYGSIVYVFEKKRLSEGTPISSATPAIGDSIFYLDCFGDITCGAFYCSCLNAEGVERQMFYLPRTLSRGASGEDVKRLQRFLKQYPEIYPEGSVTGWYGPQTESAVRRLEMACNMTPSGVVAPKLVIVINDLSFFETTEICPTLIVGKPGKGQPTQ